MKNTQQLESVSDRSYTIFGITIQAPGEQGVNV